MPRRITGINSRSDSSIRRCLRWRNDAGSFCGRTRQAEVIYGTLDNVKVEADGAII